MKKLTIVSLICICTLLLNSCATTTPTNKTISLPYEIARMNFENTQDTIEYDKKEIIFYKQDLVENENKLIEYKKVLSKTTK